MMDRERAGHIYSTMARIRAFESKALKLFEENKLRGSVHLYIGEEAVAATVCSRLTDDDYITSTHRGHGHCIAKGADLTIAVREVPWEEAPRFGILNTDENNRITEFEEKPAQPKSNKASMGVYIFSWSKMRKYLELDEANPNSDNDFGKNIIPAMLEAGENLYTYTFDGYWKDVGTIESLWEANMDLLEMPMPIDLYDKRWRIYARNPGMPPHYIADGAKVVNCLITEGCEVKGIINHSVLFAGVTVETGAEITDAVIMPGAVIERGAVVRRAIVAENAHIGAGAVVGEETGKIAVVGHNAVIPAGDKVAAGVQVDASAQQ